VTLETVALISTVYQMLTFALSFVPQGLNAMYF